jgi:hypothetical protein
MNGFDGQLRTRLVRLEAAAPAGAPPSLGRVPRLRSRVGGIALAVAATLLVTGVAVGGIALVSNGVIGHEGLFNPGQPLHCSGVNEMSPSVAQQWLTDRGYIVTWQIEDQDARTSQQAAIPPTSGYIIEGVLKGNQLTLVVETGIAAQPANIARCP